MIKFGSTAFLVLVLIALAYAADSVEDDAIQIGSEAQSSVKVLIDDNFEHLTQSTTGATTGDWFVEFYAPWCGHCKRLSETWQKLSDAMIEKRSLGEPNAIIAMVDATVNPYLSGRFKIRGFPTLIMFSQGKQYTYSGERTLEDLTKFASGGFKATDAVPVLRGTREMSAVEKAQHLWEVTIQHDLEQIWQLHKAAFFFFLGVTLLVGLLLGFCIGRASRPKRDEQQKKKQ